MFTATITKKNFTEGVMQVTVEYKNGADVFTEAYNISSENDLDNRIGNKLDTLNRLLGLETTLTIGAWTKKETPEQTELTPLQIAERNVDIAYDQLLKKKITEAEYNDIITIYKTLASSK